MAERPILKVKDFPLFAPMRSFDFPEENSHLAEDPDKNDWYMCLWKGSAEGEDFCSYPCGDFSNIIFHLKETHGVVLKSKIDFCFDCQVIFKNTTEAVSHYLEKTLLFEDRSLTLEEEDGDKKANELLVSTFTEIKRIRNELLDAILFDDDIPQLETFDLREDKPSDKDTCDCAMGAVG